MSNMKSSRAPIVAALLILIVLAIAFPIAISNQPIKISVSVVGKHLRQLGDSAYVFVYITNNAPLQTVNFRGYREAVGNVLTIESIDTQMTLNGAEYWSFTQPVTTTIVFNPPFDSITRTITSTPRPPYVGRLSPVVLPGETVAVYFASWGVGCEEPAGAFEYAFTVHATLHGSQTTQLTLKDSGKFTVERSFPACVGVSMYASDTGAAMVGAGITLTDLDTGMTIATGSIDSHGICVFYASDVPLVTDNRYKVEVTSLPPPYTVATPDEAFPPEFTWTGSTQYVVFYAS